MAVITIGTSGATWGLTAETGIITQSGESKAQREKNEVRGPDGGFVLVSYYNPLGKHTISGVIIGNTGIAAAAPGVALTIANAESGNGIPSGGIYTDDVTVTKANTEFKKISVPATQYAF